MKHFEKILLVILIEFGIVVLFIANVLSQTSVVQVNQHFVDLAYSFLNGQLSFQATARTLYDTSVFQDKYYWPLGPFPAVLLMPFVAIMGTNMAQGYMQFVLIAIIFYLLYKIAQKVVQRKSDALWLSFGYIFSTAFIGVAVMPFSWQFAQVMATVFVFAALYEYFYRKRMLIIGLYIAVAIAVRMDLILTIVFFAGMLFYQSKVSKDKISRLIAFLLPIGISIVLLLAYNYFRFNNVFDQGYTLQTLTDPSLQANRAAAVWSVIHFPANLYYFFLKGPDGVFLPGTQILTFPFLRESVWGMSIFFTSPLFLWIIKAPFHKKEVIFAGITALLIACAIFGYYGIGFSQFGYRYALDFYPFLFMLLIFAVQKQMPTLLKYIITFSFIFNIYLLVTV